MIGPLEIAANVTTAAAIFLAGRNNIHTWWIGIIGCVLFGALFYQWNLYADVALQGFFIVSSGAPAIAAPLPPLPMSGYAPCCSLFRQACWQLQRMAR